MFRTIFPSLRPIGAWPGAGDVQPSAGPAIGVPLTLRFDKAGGIRGTMTVEQPGARAPMSGMKPGMTM